MSSADSVKPFKPLHYFNDLNGFNYLNDITLRAEPGTPLITSSIHQGSAA